MFGRNGYYEKRNWEVCIWTTDEESITLSCDLAYEDAEREYEKAKKLFQQSRNNVEFIDKDGHKWFVPKNHITTIGLRKD